MSESRGSGRWHEYCPNCGVGVSSGVRFCSSCGTRLALNSETSARTETPEADTPFARRWARNKEILEALSSETANTAKSEYAKEVSLSPPEVLESAADYAMVHDGRHKLSLLSKSDKHITFQNYNPPNLKVTLLLLIPLLLYWLQAQASLFFDLNRVVFVFLLLLPVFYWFGAGIWGDANKHVYTTVSVLPVEEGCRIKVSGDSEVGRSYLRAWLRELPQMAARDERTR